MSYLSLYRNDGFWLILKFIVYDDVTFNREIDSVYANAIEWPITSCVKFNLQSWNRQRGDAIQSKLTFNPTFYRGIIGSWWADASNHKSRCKWRWIRPSITICQQTDVTQSEVTLIVILIKKCILIITLFKSHQYFLGEWFRKKKYVRTLNKLVLCINLYNPDEIFWLIYKYSKHLTEF